jgi:glc operon protein GlcG
MHRLTSLAGAICFALLISTGAFAQVPPNPDNPNDTVADALAPPPYGEPINLETAKKVAAAAIAETTKRNWNAFCVSVVTPHLLPGRAEVQFRAVRSPVRPRTLRLSD